LLKPLTSVPVFCGKNYALLLPSHFLIAGKKALLISFGAYREGHTTTLSPFGRTQKENFQQLSIRSLGKISCIITEAPPKTRVFTQAATIFHARNIPERTGASKSLTLSMS
jgi:hypothetical protein